ncbi:hypothetical protein Purlil1_7070 [Purpureocillium lilacinum]|uniref:Uncharacterized protein n=1 Tax=Purpureocillium lilacinum TaxID=33203 RepID=A0ABR0BWU1_PURLI|nr:hypothetical protein Purlil1_7070 [Purpureocillium lilacinum]
MQPAGPRPEEHPFKRVICVNVERLSRLGANIDHIDANMSQDEQKDNAAPRNRSLRHGTLMIQSVFVNTPTPAGF